MYASSFPDVEIPSGPITPFVLQLAEELADHPAMIDGPTGRTYTYAQLADGTRRVAGALAAMGVGRGDVVGILLPNMPEYFLLFHGPALLGATVTTINPTYGAEEVAFQLRDSGASMLVTIPMFVETAEKAIDGTPVTRIIVVGETTDHTPFAELMAAEPFEGHTDVNAAEDVVVLPYSSGTTGLPKGVMLTHRNLGANLVQIGHVLKTEPGQERLIAVLPFFHIYGMQVLMNNVIFRGGTVVTMPRFDLAEFLRILQDHAITIAYLVPPIVLALAKHPMVDEYDVSSLRLIFSGAAPLSGELADAVKARLGVEVVQGYGLTETSPVTHSTPEGIHNPSSVGKAIANTETRIVDPATGEDAPTGSDGEVWIRGPQVMKGYLNNPEATTLMIDSEGWLHTGDIGHVDEEGFLYIVDRLKELIKYKGFQVAPAELEGLLLTHPSIVDAAVIGLPDEEAGEIPKAFVVATPGSALTADEVMDFVAEHVASYKKVRVVEFLEAIPKSASGKILRRELRSN
jgi:acyl-CoA synthetase (AMP-forming)/AMP-acid ligase II